MANLCVVFCVFLCVQLVFCQFGFFSNREERRQNPHYQIPNILDPNRIIGNIAGRLRLRPQDRDNSQYVFPFRRPGITNEQTNPAYDNQYGVSYQNYQNPNGYNTVSFPTDATNNGYNQLNNGQNVNFNNPFNNQYPQNYGNNDYQPYSNNQNQPYNNGDENNQNANMKDVPNDPVNFEDATDAVVDPVKVVQSSEDAKEAVIDPVKVVESPEDAKDGQDTPIFVSGTVKPTDNLQTGVNFGGQNAVTSPPELTPVPESEKRNNFNFGSTGIFQETCQTVDNEIGSCISIMRCEPYLKLVREAKNNPSSVQLLRSAHCGFEGNNPKVCCPRPGIPSHQTYTTTTTTTPAPVTHAPPPDTPAPPLDDPAKGKSAGEFLDEFPNPPVCGKSTGFGGRIVGGDPATLGAYPWMALLGYKPKRGGAGARWLCGGSLASSRHVITAAHCIHLLENSLFLVRLGELDLASEKDGATPVDVLIKKMMKHEQYDAKTHANDIGVLLLDRDVEFTSLIRPICLPKDPQYHSQTFENYSPMVAGWGAVEYRGPSSTHLQVIQLPVVSNEACSRAYSAYPVVHIDDSILCAGLLKGGKDACQGDSGGPLMQPLLHNATRAVFYYQIGVVSFGKKCAEPNFPGVYSRITHYMPWLQEKMLGGAK